MSGFEQVKKDSLQDEKYSLNYETFNKIITQEQLSLFHQIDKLYTIEGEVSSLIPGNAYLFLFKYLEPTKNKYYYHTHYIAGHVVKPAVNPLTKIKLKDLMLTNVYSAIFDGNIEAVVEDLTPDSVNMNVDTKLPEPTVVVYNLKYIKPLTTESARSPASLEILLAPSADHAKENQSFINKLETMEFTIRMNVADPSFGAGGSAKTRKRSANQRRSKHRSRKTLL